MKSLKFGLLAGLAAAAVALTPSARAGDGADILLSDFGDTEHYGPIGGIHAYVFGSYTCNIGDASLSWINRGTPGFCMNTYRLHDGRLMQIGMGNAKTACCVSNVDDAFHCGMSCNAGGGFGLQPGCRDFYWAGFNSIQGSLCPRSFMNAHTGVISTAYPNAGGNDIFRRCQVNETDMTPANFPGALYFAEGHYVCTEDAVAENDNNNASYQRVTFDAGFNMLLAGGAGGMVDGVPAIYAWRDHGGGPGITDPTVTILPFDVPGEGRFILGHKVVPLGKNSWRYEYAVYNLTSDRSGGGFHVPIPPGAVVSDVGFNAPDYHSGEIYSNDNWVSTTESYEVRWNSPQTFAENANTNALRWGTLYNFWFTCDRPPVEGHIGLDLFKPAVGCVPNTMDIAASVPGADCVADVERDGEVDVDDLVAVILGWGPCACEFTCPADIAGGNDEVDVDDLVAVILGWGTCQ
jgi:hypothetical protein